MFRATLALGAAVYHTPLDMEKLAATSLGCAAGTAISAKYVAPMYESQSYSSEKKQGAAPSASASQASRTKSRPMTAAERKFEKENKMTQLNVPDPTLDLSDAKNQLSEMNRHHMKQGFFAQPSKISQAKAKNTETSVAKNGFFAGLKDELKSRYTSAEQWALSIGEQLSEKSGHMAKVYQQKATDAVIASKNALQSTVKDVFASESGSDVLFKQSQLQNAYARSYSSTSRVLMTGSSLLRRGGLAIDIAEKGLDVMLAPKGQRGRVLFEKSMEFAGEAGGTFIGAMVTGGEAVPTMGASLLVSAPVMLGSAGVGGYMFKRWAKDIEDGVDSLTYKKRF